MLEPEFLETRLLSLLESASTHPWYYRQHTGQAVPEELSFLVIILAGQGLQELQCLYCRVTAVQYNNLYCTVQPVLLPEVC